MFSTQRLRYFAISGAVFALAALPITAQTGLGVVRGTVQDASKAVVPKAKATLSDTATGIERSTVTNSDGIYDFESVPVGPYRLVIEAVGFKKWEGTLTVQAGQTVSIDPAMEVGSLANTVEVTGAGAMIETQGGQVSDVKDALTIHNLPPQRAPDFQSLRFNTRRRGRRQSAHQRHESRIHRDGSGRHVLCGPLWRRDLARAARS